MPRIRTLKPEIWMSPQVMNLSHGARLLFLGLITQADDEGRGSADARKLKAAIFGGDDITSADVRRMLDEIASQRLAVIYEDANHGILYELPSWKAHQSIDRPRKSAYPSPDDAENFREPRRTLVEPDTSPREGSDRTGPNRKGSEGTVPHAREAEDPNRVIDQIRAVYPAGQYRDSAWLKAAHFVAIRLEEGYEAVGLVEAAAKYCDQQRARGKVGTEFVLSPAKFFEGSDWRGPFPLPPSKADIRQDENLAASQTWLENANA